MYLKTGTRVFFGTLACIYLAVGVGRCAPIMPSVSKDVLLNKDKPQIPMIPGTIAEEVPFETGSKPAPSSEHEVTHATPKQYVNQDRSEGDPAETVSGLKKISSQTILSSYLKKYYPAEVSAAIAKSKLNIKLTWDEIGSLQDTGEATLHLPESTGEIAKVYVHFVSVNSQSYIFSIAPSLINAIPLNVGRSKKDPTLLTLQVPNYSEFGSTWDELSGGLIAIDAYLEIKKSAQPVLEPAVGAPLSTSAGKKSL